MLVGVKFLVLCIKRFILIKSVSFYGIWFYNLVKMIKEILFLGIVRCFFLCVKLLICWVFIIIFCCGVIRVGIVVCIVYFYKCRVGMGRVFLCMFLVIIFVNIFWVRDE